MPAQRERLRLSSIISLQDRKLWLKRVGGKHCINIQQLASCNFTLTGCTAKMHKVAISPVISARMKSGLSQTGFAKLLGVSVRTLQDWEQGRREPSGAAKTLIAIAERSPEVLREVAA